MPKPSYTVALLPGDGVGLEVAAQARRVLDQVAHSLGLRFDVEEIPCGGRYYLEHGRDWPEGSEERCRAADVILLGAVGWPAPGGDGPVMMAGGKMAGWSPVIGTRSRLDLYANIRPVKLYPGVRARICGEHQQVWKPEQVDMVFVRENTEDLYAGIGGMLERGGRVELATDTRIVTRSASERVIRLAFELARERHGAPADGKRRVTCIVKNNVMRCCQFFADVFAEIAAGYADVEHELAIVDAFTQWLLGQPDHYDVLVTTNMFGDIVTDLASVLQGGMGMAVGCNVGEAHAMFEPIHGSAPRHAGQDRVNPMAMILATAEALRWLGRRHQDERLAGAGAQVEAAVRAVLARGETLTYDLVGEQRASSGSAVGSAVLAELSRLGAPTRP
jgi:isocitrate/isopropylmalate dehydrogenase